MIRHGGRQFRVEAGQELRLPELEGEAGGTHEFDDVLLVRDEKQTWIGRPNVEGCKVVAEVLGQETLPKVVVFKMKRRKGYRVKRGHRQGVTRVRIKEIVAPAGAGAAAEAAS
jgi:large subunit ribosomal protein L21